MSTSQRGHFKTDNAAGPAATAAAPQCGQCREPMNIIPKQDGHATVASFDSQYWHCGESDEIAAPQLGQLRGCACMIVKKDTACPHKLYHAGRSFLRKNAGRINNACAMLPASISVVVCPAKIFIATLRLSLNVFLAEEKTAG